MITTFIVIVLVGGMPHIVAEHRDAVPCRAEAQQRNERARPDHRFVCVAWTRAVLEIGNAE